MEPLQQNEPTDNYIQSGWRRHGNATPPPPPSPARCTTFWSELWDRKVCIFQVTWVQHDKGVKLESVPRSKAVRKAMRNGGAEFQRQKVLVKAAGNWSTEFLRTTCAGLAQVRQTACTGVKCDLMDNKRGSSFNTKTPAATTWTEDFLRLKEASKED